MKTGWAILSMLAPSLLRSAAPPVTFHDIAPILWRKCAPCHRAGEAGPFPLLTWRDTAKRAQLIAAVTQKRYMPPWLPEHGYGDFAGELRLSDQEIRAIGDWAAAGALKGPAVEPPAFTEGWGLGKPDLVLEAPRPTPSPPRPRRLLELCVYAGAAGLTLRSRRGDTGRAITAIFSSGSRGPAARRSRWMVVASRPGKPTRAQHTRTPLWQDGATPPLAGPVLHRQAAHGIPATGAA